MLLGCLAIVAFGCTYGGASATDTKQVAELSFTRALGNAYTVGPAGAAPIASQERGVVTSDTIRGNGTRAGYLLTHGGVILGSETVTVDGSLRSRNRDYYLDDTNGSVAFVDPVRVSQTVRVSYRYSPQKEGQRSAIGGPGLALRFGQSTTLGLTYAYNTALANSAYDVVTYGLNLNTTLGKGSSMTNMLYYSTPKESGRLSMNAAGAKAPEMKSDNMFVHSSNLQSGNFGVKFSFQDVGNDFSGFTALKQQNAAPTDVLNQLEKEKGIRRMGLQADYKMGKDGSTGLGWSQIGDAGGTIQRQSLSLGDSKLKFNANFQSIDQKFTRFADLAEAERGQWAKEGGMKRSSYQLALAPLKGMAAGSSWNTLSMNDVSDKSGKLSTRALGFAGKGFSLSILDTKVDKGFARLGSLSDAERNQMALNARQEFDPNAAAGSVTDADRAHVLRETGVDRRNMRGAFAMKGGQGSLQMLDITTDTGQVSRQSMGLQGKNWQMNAVFQSIDANTKLSMLAPVEQANFGNETGMRRTNLSAGMALKSGMQLATQFSQVNSQDGGVTKLGFSMNSQKLSLSARYQDIDPRFNRVADLADADKGAMAAEQGMKRYDLTAHYVASKSITVDSYFYDAKHSTSDLFKREIRNAFAYNPVKGPKVNFFRDEVSSGSSKAATQFLHETYTLDHKLGVFKFNALQDTVTVQNPGAQDQTTQLRTLHFNTESKGRMSLVGDWKSVKQPDGKFEDTQTLNLNYTMSSKMVFTGLRTAIKTDQYTVTTQVYGVTGKLSKELNLAAKFGDTVVNGLTTGKVRELSLNPNAAKDYGAFKQVNWSLRYAEVQNAGKIQTLSDGAKLDTTLMKHKLALEYIGAVNANGTSQIVRSFSVAGDPDPKKALKYSLSYKVRDPGAGPSIYIRKYDAEWAVNPYTKLTYNYASSTEKPDGTVDPAGVERLRLTTPLSKRLGFVGQWEGSRNPAQQLAKNTLSLGLAGKLSTIGTFEASYGFDRVTTPGVLTASHTYKVKYDYQENADHYLTFSGLVVDWSGPRPANVSADDLQFQLDYKTLFN